MYRTYLNFLDLISLMKQVNIRLINQEILHFEILSTSLIFLILLVYATSKIFNIKPLIYFTSDITFVSSSEYN
jgi:hypothetical protein